MLSRVVRTLPGQVVSKRAGSLPSLRALAVNVSPLHTRAMVAQEATSSSGGKEASEKGGEEHGQQGQQQQSSSQQQQAQQSGGGGGGQQAMQSRRGDRSMGRRRGGAMRGRNVGNEFDLFRNQINRMMNEFDDSLFGGGRSTPFGGGAPNLFSLLPLSPFGLGNRGRWDMPLLGGTTADDLMDVGRGPQALLDVGDDVHEDEDALALPGTTSALDLVRGAGMPSVPTMRLDVEEMDDKYVVTTEVPGFKKEDLHVRVENGMLTIDAKHRESKKHEDPSRKFIRTERLMQSARRQLRLSADADQTPGKVKAKYQDGVLKIDVPKLAESQRSGHVEIDANVGGEESSGSSSSGSTGAQDSSKKVVMPDWSNDHIFE